MTEYKDSTIVKFSEDLKTPVELPPVESLQNDRCKFMESGKVLTKISNKSYCFQAYRTTNWHLCYVIRTSDDALIIFTAPEKGFVLNLSSAIYLKICRSETSTGKRICKVKLKWRFGKVKLKFAENQILIWRQRFLTTFGHISDSTKNSVDITSNSYKSVSKEMEHEEEWDTVESVTSLTGEYTLPSHSAKSPENFKHIGSNSLYSDTEGIASPSKTFHKQFCNCRRLLSLINHDNAKYSNKEKLQHSPMKSMQATIKNSCKDLVESGNSERENNTSAANAMQLGEKSYSFHEVNDVQNITAMSKLSESNA